MAHRQDGGSSSELGDPRLRHGTFDDDHVVGDRDAAVIIVGYISYVCPYAVLLDSVFESVRARSEGVAMVHRHLFDNSQMPGAFQAAKMVEAAARLGSFERAHRWMMNHAESAVRMAPSTVAAELGVDPVAFEQLVVAPETRLRVLRDLGGAQHLGLTIGPSYLIAGEHYEGLWCEAEIVDAIEAARERVARSKRPTLRLGPPPVTPQSGAQNGMSS